jgi:hypothetical protein
MLPQCKFGQSCYRKNPSHFLEYAHAEKEKKKQKMATEPGDGSIGINIGVSIAPSIETTQEQLTKMLFDEMELCTPFADIWPAVAAAASTLNGSQMMQRYTSSMGGSPQYWPLFYRPLVVEHWCSALEIAEAVKNGNYRLDVYWRALDRYPGGNADFHTIRFRFNHEQTVTCRDFYNWDGTPGFEEFVPSMNPATIRPLAESLCTLKDTSLDVYSNTRQTDSDEYDSEWSSREIILFVPRPWHPRTHAFFSKSIRLSIRTFLLVNMRLSSRLTRDCLSVVFQQIVGSSYAPVRRLHISVAKISGIQLVPETVQVSSIFKHAANLIGMERVHNWTDAGDDEPQCPAAADPAKKEAIRTSNHYSQHFPYIQPLQFREAVN